MQNVGGSYMSLCLLLIGTLVFYPFLNSHAEGSAQLTPNDGGSSSGSNVTNTFVGYLQHDDGGNSRSFMKPSTYSGYDKDHRLYIYVEDGETLYYGIRRRTTNGGNNQQDLILTLKYEESGTVFTVRTDTLLRDQTSTRHSTLLPDSGVIATPA